LLACFSIFTTAKLGVKQSQSKTMRPVRGGPYVNFPLTVFGCWLLAITFLFGCSAPKWYFGTGGKYNEARLEITRRRGGNLDKAIANLEAVVTQDPTYRDSLTLLGRAYYKKERYREADLVLQRALQVDKEDEIGWLTLGLTQLRLGQDETGLEALKGGLTLINKVSTGGYRGHEHWDRAGKVKLAIRRAVILALKGLEDKENLVGSGENVLAAIDEEEFFQRFEKREALEQYR
jgi:tetratricopeptide (TPR) repeat protein